MITGAVPATMTGITTGIPITTAMTMIVPIGGMSVKSGNEDTGGGMSAKSKRGVMRKDSSGGNIAGKSEGSGGKNVGRREKGTSITARYPGKELGGRMWTDSALTKWRPAPGRHF